MCKIYHRHQANREWCYFGHHAISRKNTWGAQDHSWTVMKSSSSRTACQKWTGWPVSENCQRFTCLFTASVVWCIRNAPNLLGIPTWFLTLSTADLHWPEMIQAVVIQFGRKLSQKDVLKNEHCRQKQTLAPKPHNWCLNVSTQNWGILLWIPTQCCTPTRPYHRLCDKNWVPDERITSCPLLAVGKRFPKVGKDPDDIVCAFIDKYITVVIPPIVPENENHIKLMENLQNIHILTIVIETNLVVLVFQNPLQQNLNI